MVFSWKFSTSWAIALIIILLLLPGCSGKNDAPVVTVPATPPPEKYSVSLCENVFMAYLSGEIPSSELLYVDEEKHIALRETDVIINQGSNSSFWVMTSFKDLVTEQNYNLRYELYFGGNELFRSESFTFSSNTPEHTSWIIEEINPQNRKKLSAGEWTVKIYVNNTLLAAKNISILSATPGQDVVRKEYQWKDFHFQYPGYCTIEEDRDIVNEKGEQFRLVKLTVSGKNRIGLFLYFADNWVPPNEDLTRQSPAMVNMMLGLPIALKHAEPVGAKAIALSVGSIELIDGFSLATRFIIVKPGSDTFSSLECFHRSGSDTMFFGILFTQGLKGKGSDTPEYFRFIQDAYTIIRSISIPELRTNTDGSTK